MRQKKERENMRVQHELEQEKLKKEEEKYSITMEHNES
jgi:hypothetical protein